ncbi:hypothetical protein CLU79DRAFT_704664, partial [Phycomyces nitens]
IYIYGGADADSTYTFNDLWSFDPNTLKYVNLTQPNQAYRYTHTATALPNGMIVFLDGLFTKGSPPVPDINDINIVDIFDTNNNRWIKMRTVGRITPTRSGGCAQLAPDNKTIISFGGNKDSTSVDSMDTYYSNILLLDTDTWIWTIPRISGDSPAGRLYFSMGFIGTDLLAILYGDLSNLGYNDVNILRINNQNTSTLSWLSGPDEYLGINQPEDTSGRLSKGAIAAIITFSILFISTLAYGIWRTIKIKDFLPSVVKNFFWDPRQPLWTEMSRLVLRAILLFLFVSYVIFSITQALWSPTTSITMRTKVVAVQVPDVRFCIEGLEMPLNPTEAIKSEFRNRIDCITDKGVSCSGFITWLDTSIHLPRFENSVGSSDCYLFSPPSSFRLGATGGGITSGSKLHFDFNGEPQETITIQITQYPPGMDPNIKIYNTNTSDVPLIMSDEAVKEWSVRDIKGNNDPNTFIVYTNEALSIQYQIKDHQYLEETGWNKIGFLSRYNHTPEIMYSSIKSNFTIIRERFMTKYPFFSTTTLYPMDFYEVIEQDQKIHTIINSLGSVGGIISIILGIQAWLFGIRPKSPWGVVQRWSFGAVKYSLKKRLREEFHEPDIPISHVHAKKGQPKDKKNKDDSKTEESVEQKLANLQKSLHIMEERTRLAELLLSSYYVDNEIFKTLHSATNPPENKSSTDTSTFLQQDKYCEI